MMTRRYFIYTYIKLLLSSKNIHKSGATIALPNSRRIKHKSINTLLLDCVGVLSIKKSISQTVPMRNFTLNETRLLSSLIIKDTAKTNCQEMTRLALLPSSWRCRCESLIQLPLSMSISIFYGQLSRISAFTRVICKLYVKCPYHS